MKPVTENSVLDNNPVKIQVKKVKKIKIKTSVIFHNLLVFLLLGVSAFLFYQNLQLRTTECPLCSEANPSLVPTNLPPVISETGWKKTNFGNQFSFEYPVGWHVAEIWQMYPDQNTVIVIAIDPNPISTAPRGGPLATFEISVKNGLINPNEIFKKDQENFKDGLNNLEQETLQSNIGPVYYYKGKIKGEMLQGSPMEGYFLTIENPDDPINQQVLSATLSLKDDERLSEMLRKIVLSINKIPARGMTP